MEAAAQARANTNTSFLRCVRAYLESQERHATNAGEDREEQRMVLCEAVHPRAALVVDKEHCDDLPSIKYKPKQTRRQFPVLDLLSSGESCVREFC